MQNTVRRLTFQAKKLRRNDKQTKIFPCFHRVIETRVEVWENEKLKWEHESVEFSQTFTSDSTTYGTVTRGGGGGGVLNSIYFISLINQVKRKA